jgi:hypothetical protein
MTPETHIHPYTSTFIKLLRGPIEYIEKSSWEKLLTYRNELQAFARPLGLTLVIDEADGYAYMRHAYGEDEEVDVIWMQRRPFTYEESIMLVLLREMMAEFETGEATTRELIRKRRELKEYVELFFKEKASRVKFLRDLDRLIDRMRDYGFLELSEDHEVPDEQRFRIRKMIKARISSEVLDDFYRQLQEEKANRLTEDPAATTELNPTLPF